MYYWFSILVAIPSAKINLASDTQAPRPDLSDAIFCVLYLPCVLTQFSTPPPSGRYVASYRRPVASPSLLTSIPPSNVPFAFSLLPHVRRPLQDAPLPSPFWVPS